MRRLPAKSNIIGKPRVRGVGVVRALGPSLALHRLVLSTRQRVEFASAWRGHHLRLRLNAREVRRSPDSARVSRTRFFFQAEDGIRDHCVTGVQTCALPISGSVGHRCAEVTARARIFPDWMMGTYEARLSIAKFTSPASMAGIVCAAPRNGT